ncbi:MAG: thiamine biosynthesis protein ThiS [Alphaproteobacteria bacterium]|nr:MAG: thiamine biosynthesis protein ThiS [Alphaproteobacteria bacterium]
MKITINGTIKTIDNAMNIHNFLISEGYEDKLVAIAINNHFIARTAYNDYTIQDNDIIEIVAPMQGG